MSKEHVAEVLGKLHRKLLAIQQTSNLFWVILGWMKHVVCLSYTYREAIFQQGYKTEVFSTCDLS